MNWTKIAEGLGVEASRATTAEEFNAQYALEFSDGLYRIFRKIGT